VVLALIKRHCTKQTRFCWHLFSKLYFLQLFRGQRPNGRDLWGQIGLCRCRMMTGAPSRRKSCKKYVPVPMRGKIVGKNLQVHRNRGCMASRRSVPGLGWTQVAWYCTPHSGAPSIQLDPPPDHPCWGNTLDTASMPNKKLSTEGKGGTTCWHVGLGESKWHGIVPHTQELLHTGDGTPRTPLPGAQMAASGMYPFFPQKFSKYKQVTRWTASLSGPFGRSWRVLGTL